MVSDGGGMGSRCRNAAGEPAPVLVEYLYEAQFSMCRCWATGEHGGRATMKVEVFAEAAIPGTPRVLVVDDDAAMQRMLVSYLGENSMQATAVSGREGVVRALAGREPDVILLDINLG